MNAISSFLATKRPSQSQNIHINTIFPKIYLINLKRRTDRLHKMMSMLQSHNIKFQVIEAVDGLSYVIENRDELQTKFKSNGEWAYLLTWKNMINDAKAHGYSSFVSFDDDIILCKNFHIRFNQWIRSVFGDEIWQGKWKIIHFGATQSPKHLT